MDVTDPDALLIALAEHIGRHAVGWYIGLVVLALALAAAGVRLLERRELPGWATVRGRTVLPPLFVLNLLIGFGLVVAAAATFAELSELLVEDGNRLGAFDDALGRALVANVPDAAMAYFALVTRLGDVAVLVVLGVLVAAALLIRRRFALAVFWSLSLAGNGLLTRLLKSLFERVRPVHEQPLVTADGWSFPSGHTSGALVAYGLLAWLAWRLLPRSWRMPAVLAATAVALSVGVSRVFLRVHHASDVLAGWASGGIWLVVSIASAELARRAMARRREPRMATG